jgi:hypothetical protein
MKNFTVWYNIHDSRYVGGDFVFVCGLDRKTADRVAECYRGELLFQLGTDVDVKVWVE